MRPRHVGILLVSSATLLFELTLMRLYALAQGHHYAFMSVSVALLGNALSGTVAALFSRRTLRALDGWATPLLPLALLGAYLVLAHLPFDAYLLAWEPRQLVRLLQNWLTLTLPFALSGYLLLRAIGAEGEHGHMAYGANLAGSAAGGVLLLALLPLVGAEGAVLVAAILAALGGALLQLGPADAAPQTRRRALASALAVGLACGALLAARPGWLVLPLSPYRSLSQLLLTEGAELRYQAWNSHSRVDVVAAPSLHSAPGLSLTFTGDLPPQMGIAVDGGDLCPIARRATPADEAYLRYLPEALPYELRPRARALVLTPCGGTQVALALAHDAATVAASEANATVQHVLTTVFGEYTDHLYRDPRVTVRIEGGRTALSRAGEPFDLVVLPLTRPFAPLTAGTYALSEDYVYTIEGLSAALLRLDTRGLLVMTRWVQEPPAEMLRAAALLIEALARQGVAQPGEHLFVYRTWSTVTLLASPTPLAAAEVAALKARCNTLGWDVLHAPGAADATPRYHLGGGADEGALLSALLTARDREAFYRQQMYDISPPSDDRPFFEHYFRWAQLPGVIARLGKTWQPFGGSGYLLVLALLVAAVAAAAALTMLAQRAERNAWPQRQRAVAYMALVGLAFMLVEMPLLQQFILYLEHPARAAALVLATLLLASGVGSLLAGRAPLRLGLVLLGLLIPVGTAALPALVRLTLVWPLLARAGLCVLALAPLGLLMGLPFSGALRRLGASRERALPWAWAANGGASVVGTLLATVLALASGYRLVLWLGAGCYLLAALCLWPAEAAD